MRTDLILFHLRLHFSLVFLVMSNQIVCCHTIKLYIWFVFVFIIFFCFAFISAFMHLLELCVCSELIAIVIAFGVSVCVFFWLFVLIAFRKTFLVHSNTEHSTHTLHIHGKKLSTAAKMCKRWTGATEATEAAVTEMKRITCIMYTVFLYMLTLVCSRYESRAKKKIAILFVLPFWLMPPPLLHFSRCFQCDAAFPTERIFLYFFLLKIFIFLLLTTRWAPHKKLFLDICKSDFHLIVIVGKKKNFG